MKMVEMFNKFTNMENLKELLNENVVCFTFRKVNGEERQAIATRAMLKDSEFSSYINFTESDLPKGTGIDSDTTIRYWDLEKCGWRSCRIDSVISIEDVTKPKDYINYIEKGLEEFNRLESNLDNLLKL